jgi:hypothetical protein
MLGFAEAFPFELREQEIDGTLDDEAEVATRIRMTRQIQAALELFAELDARSELDAHAFRGNCTHPCGGVSLGETGREEQLDVALRSPVNGLEELGVVLFGQVRSQQHERRQMNLARSDESVDDRKPPPKARRSEPAKGLTFTHAKLLHAEFEHRRKPRQ